MRAQAGVARTDPPGIRLVRPGTGNFVTEGDSSASARHAISAYVRTLAVRRSRPGSPGSGHSARESADGYAELAVAFTVLRANLDSSPVTKMPALIVSAAGLFEFTLGGWCPGLGLARCAGQWSSSAAAVLV